jgi:hypothetical protein
MTSSNRSSRSVVLRTTPFTLMILLFQAGMRNCVGPTRRTSSAILVLLTGHELTESGPVKSPCIRAIGFGLAQSMHASRATCQSPRPSRCRLQPRSMPRWRRPAFVRRILRMPSPFRTRSKERDPGRTALFIAAGIALLALIAGLIAVLTMHAPTQ